MRRLVLKMSMSLDGYVGGPTGEIDWIMRTLDRDATAWIDGLDTTRPAAGWDDTRVLGADLAADIEALKAEPGKDLVAHGGASFAQALVRYGLIDEYRVLVHPVVLGSGLALLDGARPSDLTLVDATTFPSGIQGLVYQPN